MVIASGALDSITAPKPSPSSDEGRVELMGSALAKDISIILGGNPLIWRF
jgi:hypothetical protein